MKILFYLYDGMTMLDAIGPYEVLRQLDGVEVSFVAKKRGEITADSQVLHINVKQGIDKVEEADILIIPGSTVGFVREMKDKKVLEWIKKMDKVTKKTVTVCTGSIILAATGLLEGKKATSHWKPIELLKEFGAIPTRERMVVEGKYVTAAGVSAGIDMALHLAKEIAGEEAAKAAQLSIEYDPHPPFRSGNYTTAEESVIKLSEKQMEAQAKKDLSLWQRIRHVGTLWKLR